MSFNKRSIGPMRGDCDREFLLWCADRFVRVYGEHPGVDFIGRLVSIAESFNTRRRTANTKLYVPFEVRKLGQNAQNEHPTRPILTDSDLQTDPVKPGQIE